MDPRYLPIIDGLLLIGLFVVAPLISAAIGYVAWKGKPNGFDRERYGLSAIAAGAPGIALMVYTQRTRVDVRTHAVFLTTCVFCTGGSAPERRGRLLCRSLYL